MRRSKNVLRRMPQAANVNLKPQFAMHNASRRIRHTPRNKPRFEPVFDVFLDGPLIFDVQISFGPWFWAY